MSKFIETFVITDLNGVERRLKYALQYDHKVFKDFWYRWAYEGVLDAYERAKGNKEIIEFINEYVSELIDKYC